jgi:molybdopterin/thiamine biosynthesis adenylyltransferase/proteasome lid subunit RPN8/RPN11
MRYSLSLRENHLQRLKELVFSVPDCEGAAYLLCGQSSGEGELRLLGREVVPVLGNQYCLREPNFLSIVSASYAHVAKRARNEQLSIIFVHSHPGGFLDFSDQDDREEKKLQEFFLSRAPDNLHGALVMTQDGLIGRVFSNGFLAIERIRIIGDRFIFYDRLRNDARHLQFFDRQVRAFGHETQMLLQSLHIGIIGAGGTGSAVAEQLTRLGVGMLSIFDGDKFDPTNVNRLYGSSTRDGSRPKAEVVMEHLNRIGLSAKINAINEAITQESVAKHLRGCDLIFGCTDKEAPRAILVKLALRYLIPIIDLGVVIHSANGSITDVIGRVTTVFPGEACLFCRNRISAEAIRLEGLPDEERSQLIREGYAPELLAPNPAVISFTTCIASLAIIELLHRLTGFMGKERQSSEVLCLFDQSRLRTNRVPPVNGCLCAQPLLWGAGDSTPFLDSTWSV